MKKEQAVLSDTSVPDPLNVFAKKIGQRIRVYGDKSKVTAKEFLTTLTSSHNQLHCLPLIKNSEKCNGMNNKFNKTPEDDNDKKVDVSLKKIFNDIEEKVGEEETETNCSSSLTDELELSYDGKWLRKFFKSPLKMAIKEIVSKKPYDPVSYLGFWLLNYRRCQERRQRQLETDNELSYYRSLIEEPISEGEEVSVDGGEGEEEEMRDWNFKYYETAHMSK